MKTKISAVILAASACLLSQLHAADPAPKASAAAPQADAASPLQLQLQKLVGRVKMKLGQGQNTEAALKDELKEFDDLLAAHKGEKTDEVSQILVMKALLYVQVFHDFDKGEALFQQLKADFPDTEAGKNVDQILPALQQQKASMAARAALSAGKEFPDFQEKDVAGQPLSISKYKGKIVLVDFWATWCGPCVGELPNVLAAYQKYHDKGFEIVGISLDKNKDELEKFVKEKGMTWQQYFDGQGWDSKLGKKYGITAIPATFLLDGEGKIIATDLRGDGLEKELSKRLAAK